MHYLKHSFPYTKCILPVRSGQQNMRLGLKLPVYEMGITTPSYPVQSEGCRTDQYTGMGQGSCWGGAVSRQQGKNFVAT